MPVIINEIENVAGPGRPAPDSGPKPRGPALPDRASAQAGRTLYGVYPAVVENVVDPAHVPVSHHNVVGNRYKDATAQTMTMVKPMTKEGFCMKIDDANDLILTH